MYGTKEQALVYTLTLSFNARHVMVGTTPGKNPNACLVAYGGNGYSAHRRMSVLGGYSIDFIDPTAIITRRVRSKPQKNENDGARPHSTDPASPPPASNPFPMR